MTNSLSYAAQTAPLTVVEFTRYYLARDIAFFRLGAISYGDVLDSVNRLRSIRALHRRTLDWTGARCLCRKHLESGGSYPSYRHAEEHGTAADYARLTAELVRLCAVHARMPVLTTNARAETAVICET